MRQHSCARALAALTMVTMVSFVNERSMARIDPPICVWACVIPLTNDAVPAPLCSHPTHPDAPKRVRMTPTAKTVYAEADHPPRRLAHRSAVPPAVSSIAARERSRSGRGT
jgi:hypothetical protein